MSNKMLIDASHPEETRVVVTRGNRIEEFDFESQSKKQLKGNIYLARVTRVEPSLQAAFVEYGGNRHGFLAFSEIHPDYYQIPVADRQAILADEAREAAAEDDDEDLEKTETSKRKRRRGGRGRGRATTETASDNGDDGISAAENASEVGDDIEPLDSEQAELSGAESDDEKLENAESGSVDEEDTGKGETPKGSGGPAMAASVHSDVISEELPGEDEARDVAADDLDAEEDGAVAVEEDGSPSAKKRSRRSARGKRPREREDEAADDNGVIVDENDDVEMVGADDALEEVASRRRPVRRQYKIQEVIKRRQILLVQVVKEERGNKGAALTTYLSLAGRYSVLMPNTARGGGISRKITNIQDRKRLKEVVRELDVPQGMGVILRTAGANRTKAEIKRDYEYLMRLWMTIRNLTLKSTAPALVHEEGSLIKRSVRDLYNKDISEILVAGDEGYREAKDFMRMLMPSHAKAVQPYKDNVPIFARNGIEAQLDRMLQPQVTLKSGGYIIINQTEALVAIDVNSGRSTREHSIEDTALQTNLEAAEEVARQLRLRDLAGLVVIDFIDMEEKRNNRSVEKRLKECLRHDRARIQVGRISHFGLLEMSRQRIRASVLESTMKPCEVCHGTGHVRSDSSVALHVIRGIEEHLMKDSGHDIVVRTPTNTALYVLNNKRATLSELEERFGLTISVEADQTLGSQHFQIVKGAPSERPARVAPEQPAVEMVDAEPEVEEIEPEVEEQPVERAEEGGGKRRRKRRRRKSGRSEDSGARTEDKDNASAAGAEELPAGAEGADSEDDDSETTADEGSSGTRKRRRGRRGGKRNRSGDDGTTEADAADADLGEASTESVKIETQLVAETDQESSGKDKQAPKPDNDEKGVAKTGKQDAAAEAEDKSDRQRRGSARAAATSVPAEPVVTSIVSGGGKKAADGEQPRKEGWWKRKGFF